MALVFVWAVMETTAFDLSEVYQVPCCQAPLSLGGSSGWAAEWLP